MLQLRCCGAKSPEDWNSSQWRLKVWSETIEAVPASCCKTNTTSQCGLRIHPSSIAFTVNHGDFVKIGFLLPCFFIIILKRN